MGKADAMAQAVKRLTARSVATVTDPGRHSDGDGLYLNVAKGGAKSWLFLYRWQGARKEMGLGGIGKVSLAKAREKAAEYRAMVADGINPLEARHGFPHRAIPTFGAFADRMIEEWAPGFRNEKHVAQWRMTMGDAYCASIRHKPVDEIVTEDVLAVLSPIWLAKAETASRLRGRIERVLDAARAKGHRSGENPARLKGHLDALLPKRERLQRGHHAAMPYRNIPAFLRDLRANGSVSALALEFAILTAARSGEVMGATWAEIDSGDRLWRVPASRMKAGKAHEVPLTARCLEILDRMSLLRPEGDNGGAFVFPGQRRGKGLSVMALAMAMRRLGQGDYTPHGFRSAFRDWAGDETDAAREVAEAALAHAVGNAVEQAYRRQNALDKRRTLMAAWAEYCAGGKASAPGGAA